uniref:Uncharacterized protein n=1 Tax=Arundo donax TaxID=35708 RepID=A0A0A9A1W4_ARUDO
MNFSYVQHLIILARAGCIFHASEAIYPGS